MRVDIIGYDPGGDGTHGVARLSVRDGSLVSQPAFATVECADAAIRWIETQGTPDAIGIDTLTVWSTGPKGLRPADRYLRATYPAVAQSVIAPNSLRGAMVVNGISLAHTLRRQSPSIVLSETHPKVLYFALTGRRYEYERAHVEMDAALSCFLGLEVVTASEHEWDALLSAFATLQGVEGRWHGDLHGLKLAPGERLVQPTGPTCYFWP